MRRLWGDFWGVKLDVLSRETEVHLAFSHEKTEGTCQFDRENTVPSERQMGGRGVGPLGFSRETEVHLGFSHEKTKGECQFERENTMPNERSRGEKGASGPFWALGSYFGTVFYRVK